MNRRERLRRCYFGEETDRPAVYSRAGFPKDDPSYDELKACLARHSELKGGWGSGSLLMHFPYDERTESYSADFARQITTLHTPAGDLTSTTLRSLKGQPGLQETHFVKDRADAEKYLSLPMPTISGDVSAFFEADRAMGDKGIVETGLGRNPGGAVAGLLGSDTFAMMSITDRDIIHVLCERFMQINLDLAKYVISKGVGPYFGMAGEELIVPPLHGPADFQDFNVRYDKPIVDLVHAAGGRVHVHSHGSIKKVFQGFLDIGVDVLHPFEPPPMGNITAAEAKALARGRMCLEGNIQINRMYEATPAAIREETQALIRDTFDDRRGLIVSPTASPYIRGAGKTCFPQYKAMIDTVLGCNG